MKGYGVTLSPMSRISLRTPSSDSPVSGYAGFVQLARETEDAGFSGVYIPEAVNDALMCSLSVANATKRITIATWIVNIYLREPALCAISAETVQEAAQGRRSWVSASVIGQRWRPAASRWAIARASAPRHRGDSQSL